jgi:hypothetical protein
MVPFFLASLYPLWRLRRANLHTSLIPTCYWTFAAWVSWGILFFETGSLKYSDYLELRRYVALCLTACAGVAVLGARRPHVTAWNAVVIGLLVVMLLPLAENKVLGTPLMTGLRAWFLGVTLALVVANYLPTRFGPAAVLLGIGLTAEFVKLLDAESVRHSLLDPASFCLLLTPWVALVRRTRATLSPFDSLWLDFRDRYGLFWALRVREQFNASMQHAGQTVRLTWTGLSSVPAAGRFDEEQMAAALEALRALLKRFLPPT